MLKLAWNALASLGSFYDSARRWWNSMEVLSSSAYNLQEDQGLNLGNKFSAQHLQIQEHKMNVR
jgi:hypothetical protein